jgi:hypothetical protein
LLRLRWLRLLLLRLLLLLLRRQLLLGSGRKAAWVHSVAPARRRRRKIGRS